MSNEITMPKLSDTMEEGKIIRWLKHPGDAVHHGDALAEVETDKADMVMESFDDGVLEEIRLKEGESAPVGATIATIRTTGEAPRPSTADHAVESSVANTASARRPPRRPCQGRGSQCRARDAAAAVEAPARRGRDSARSGDDIASSGRGARSRRR